MSFQSIANKFVCDIPVYEPGRPVEEVAREFGFTPRTVCKLASNENALGPSPKALQAMRQALASSHLYPDGGGFYLRQALAKHWGIKPDNIILGNGSNEIMEFIYHAFVQPGDEVIVGDQSFVIYKFLAKMFQARCVEVPFKKHTHDLTAMREAITHRTKVVFIASPNNPTGTRVSNSKLAEFMRHLPDHILVVLDEAYVEFLNDPPSSLAYAMKRNVVLLRTFSKIVGLAGLRVGYGVSQKECISVLQRVRQPFNCNAIAQAGAVAALNDKAHVQRTKTMTRRGLKYFEREFRRLNLEYVPSCANFILVNVGDGDEISRRLQRGGVIVRPMRGYNMPECVRVTVGLPPQNRKFIRILENCGPPL